MVTAGATGTGVSCSAATTLYSRAMSCADGVSPCSGGRRNTHFEVSSETRNVRLDRPPEISSARNSPVRAMPTDCRWRSRASRSSPSSEVVTGLVYHRRLLLFARALIADFCSSRERSSPPFALRARALIAAFCSSRERSSLIPRQQVPYVLSAVDGGDIQVALA